MADHRQIPEGDLVDLLDAVARLAPVPTLVTDTEGRFLAANRTWRNLSGLTDQADPPERWTDGLDPDGRARLAQAMDECARTGTAATLELEMDGPSGPRWTRWWMHRRLIEATAVLVLVALDVHEDVTQRDDLRQLATRDDLTGLVNRRVFLETVEQALRRTERFGEPAGVLYIDLDSFKAVNDQAGHAVGDRVLAGVASQLRTAVRAADVVGRIGGDEFAVLLERLASPGEAAIVARRVQEALSGSVEVDGRHWPISASVGIALAGVRGETAMGLLSRADTEMYAAKRARTRPLAAAATGGAPAPNGDGNRGKRPTVTAADLRLLREGMDTIRQSLETLLNDLQHQDR